MRQPTRLNGVEQAVTTHMLTVELKEERTLPFRSLVPSSEIFFFL